MKRTFRFRVFLPVLLLALLLAVLLAQRLQENRQYGAGGGHTYYVSKTGKNTDGKSWQTAWNELDKINWSVVQPGDTILLDGGSWNMTYTTTLTIGKSGIKGFPITIRKAPDAGHNGHVEIFGGRSTPLPYCDQTHYHVQTGGINGSGINIGDASWLVIDGGNWDGISIHGTDDAGVFFGGNSSSDIIRNLETYDNGALQQSNGTFSPVAWGGGILVYGSNHLFEQVNAHDDAGDSFQPSGNNITINRSWLHQTREDPTQPGTPFNQCEHQDGYQIWDTGIHWGITIENSIIGPGQKEGTILGQTAVAGTAQGEAVVNNVALRNDLFNSKVINIEGYPHVKETGWVVDHVTIFGTFSSVAIWLEGTGHTVTNSIFYDGHIYLPDGLAGSSGNCQWRTDANASVIVGQTVDPQFVTDVSGFSEKTPLAALAGADFSLKGTSPCAGKGSSITSVAQFLRIVTASQPTPTNFR